MLGCGRAAIISTAHYPPCKLLRAKPETPSPSLKVAHAAERHWGYPERWIEAWLTSDDAPGVSPRRKHSTPRQGRSAVGVLCLTKRTMGFHLDHLRVIPAAMGQGVAAPCSSTRRPEQRSWFHFDQDREATTPGPRRFTDMWAPRGASGRLGESRGPTARAPPCCNTE
jgi:hypothetical protein